MSDLQIETWATDRLVEYARNPRRNDHAVERVAAAIREFGFRVPIIALSDGTIVDGHLRLKAARHLGLATVPVVLADDLSEAQVRAFRISVNRMAELADWDDELLALELTDLVDFDIDLALTGFDDAAIAGLLAGPEPQAPVPTEGLTDPDDLPALVPQAVSRPGDIWQLGAHRLGCGDSGDAGFVQAVTGAPAALLFTSPPYGQQRDYGAAKDQVGDWLGLMQKVFAAAPMAPAGQLLVNLGLVHKSNEWQPYWDPWLDWMRAQGWRRFGLYVWDQGPGLPGDWAGRLAPSFELIFHFNRQARKPNKTVPCTWAGTDTHAKGRSLRNKDGTIAEWTHKGREVQTHRIPDNVLRITRHKARGIEVEHPAVFPVALAEAILAAWTAPGEIVLEPFCGSGTTLIAGERTGRRVAAVDIDPAYVDLAIRRWQAFTGREAVLEHDGRGFADLRLARAVAGVAG